MDNFRGSLVNSHLALPAIAEKADQDVVVVDTERGVLEVIKEMMNFSLLTNPLFLLIGISNAFGMIGFYTPFVYLPSMAAQFVRINPQCCQAHLNFLSSRTISVWRMPPSSSLSSASPTL